MRIYVTADDDAMGYRAAMFIKDQLEKRHDAVLGLATGGTMVNLYKHLVRMHERSSISFKSVITFNLDEYVGLTAGHPASFHRFMAQHLFNHVDIAAQNIHIPDGMAPDLQAECKRYDDLIKTCGGIDVQVLGIGLNGHIGFNEPGTPFDTTTHVVALTDSTRQANARFFNGIDTVPKEAITMGIKTIMQSRAVLLLASGKAKAQIIAKALTGPITPEVPASILQLHPQLTVILDKAAASAISDGDLYCSFVA